jgi:hypothetical protein
MTLLDAPAFDSRRANTIRTLSIVGVVVLVVAIIGTLLGILQMPWWFWHWPSDHKINQFMGSVESGDLNKAYGEWNHDANWQQHPAQYQPYGINEFTKDWGPSSDYGTIKSHKIFISHRVGNGVIIGVYVNGNTGKPLFLRMDSGTKTIGFSPVELYSGP